MTSQTLKQIEVSHFFIALVVTHHKIMVWKRLWNIFQRNLYGEGFYGFLCRPFFLFVTMNKYYFHSTFFFGLTNTKLTNNLQFLSKRSKKAAYKAIK